MKRKVLTESQKRQLILKKLRQIIREEIERAELETLEERFRLKNLFSPSKWFQPDEEEDVNKTQKIDMSKVRYFPVGQAKKQLITKNTLPGIIAGQELKDIWEWLNIRERTGSGSEKTFGYPGSISAMSTNLDIGFENLRKLQFALRLSSFNEDEKFLNYHLDKLYLDFAKIKQILITISRKRFDALYRMLSEKSFQDEAVIFIKTLGNIVKLFNYIKEKVIVNKTDKQLNNMMENKETRRLLIKDINDFLEYYYMQSETTRSEKEISQFQRILNKAVKQESRKYKKFRI